MVYGVLKRVFANLRYVGCVAGVIFGVLSLALLLPNISIIIRIFSSSDIYLTEKISFLFSMYGTLFSANTIFSGSVLISTALLFGINIGLLTYYVRRRQETAGDKKAHVASIGGAVSAALGLGCAACGSVVLTSVLGLAGAGGLLLVLPFNGAEFGILGILLLLFSIRYLIKRIDDPLVCPL